MTMIGVSWYMFLLVLAHPGCPGQSPESHKMVVVVAVVFRFFLFVPSRKSVQVDLTEVTLLTQKNVWLNLNGLHLVFSRNAFML